MPPAFEVLRDFDLAVVTGGSSGIGNGFIATMREAKPDLAICNLSRRPCGFAGIEDCSVDLADGAARRAAMTRVTAWAAGRGEAGRMLLINNSGFGRYGAFPEPETRDHLEMIAVNITALVELTGVLLPELKRRGGAIVNVASTSAFQPVPHLQTYAATKAFVLSWSVALARELHDTGVAVQALCPGPTRTGFQSRAGFAGPGLSDRFAHEVADVVNACFRGLARGRTIVVPGWRNRALAALARLAPMVLAARVAGELVARNRLGSR